LKLGTTAGFDFFTNPSRFWECLPIGAGIVTVLATHELGHCLHVVIKFASVRLFFSHLQIGAFGAVTRFESLVPNRKVLFDVAFAGPAGGIVSLLMLSAF